MAIVYAMKLEDRVDLARDQLQTVILKLRRLVKEQGLSEEVGRTVDLATGQLEHIGELIGR